MRWEAGSLWSDHAECCGSRRRLRNTSQPSPSWKESTGLFLNTNRKDMFWKLISKVLLNKNNLSINWLEIPIKQSNSLNRLVNLFWYFLPLPWALNEGVKLVLWRKLIQWPKLQRNFRIKWDRCQFWKFCGPYQARLLELFPTSSETRNKKPKSCLPKNWFANHQNSNSPVCWNSLTGFGP